MISPYYQNTKTGIIIHLKVTPNASKNAISEVISGADGQQLLKVKVAAVPDDNKANKALIKFLAKEWGISPSAIEIISGQTARNKKLMIAYDNSLLERLPKV